MKATNLLLLFLLLSFNSIAEFTSEQKVELDKKVYKTELFLKEIIAKDLASMLSTEGILVSVEIKVDEKKIYNEVGGLDDKWDRVKTMQLPGLFLDSGSQESLKEVKGISEENVLANITNLNVQVTVGYENLDLERVKELTQLIIESNYSRMEVIKLNIETSYRAPLIVEKKENFMAKFKGATPYALVGVLVALIFLFALFRIAGTFKKSIDGLNDVIANKDLSGNLSIKQAKADPIAEQKKKDLPVSGNVSAIDQYYKIVDKIKSSFSHNHEVIGQMISFSFHLEDYQKIIVLVESLPEDQKGEIYNNIPKASVKKFKDYLVFNGDDLYTSGVELLESAKDIVKMLSLSNISSENFYSYYLKEISNGLSVSNIAGVINDLSINELMYFIEFVDKASLGFAIASSNFDPMKFSADYRELTQDEVKLCVGKISNLLMKNSSGEDVDPRASILPFLTGETEEVVMRKLNIDRTSSFAYMVEKNLAKVVSFIKEQEYEEMVYSLALFKESVRDEIIVGMPDILAERLLKEEYKLSKESLVMKSIIMTHLDQVTPKLEQSA